MVRRVLFVLAISAVVVGPALPAGAATTRDVKVPGTNWYWGAQTRVKSSDHVSCPEGAPACPSHQQDLESTHSPGSLPVKVLRGEDEKISAIEFDLSFIPVQGATIDRFSFSIIESQTEQDRSQTLNASGKTIQACPIEETWASSLESGATTMKERPKYSTTQCVKGKRKGSANPPRWEFNITTLATAWGNNPSSAHGVMLVGVKPADSSDTWQIVLRGPYRNEEAKTAGQSFIKATAVYTPKAAPTTSSFSTSYSTSTGYPAASSGTSTGFGFGTSDAPVFPEASSPVTPAAGAPPVPFGGTVPTAAAEEQQQGGMPPYFWLIIPTALMAFSLVRHTVLEPAIGKRPDGVVALIRRQNAARLGRPARPDSRSPLAGFSGIFRNTGQRIRSVARRVVSGGKRR